jgi:hypothetical protein
VHLTLKVYARHADINGMNRLTRFLVLAALAVCALMLAGCENETDGVAANSKATKLKITYCYRLDPDYPDEKGPCWVTFPDGMQCLRSDNGHGDVFSPCTGGHYEQIRRSLEDETPLDES